VDDAAEVAALKTRLLVRDDIRLDVAEGRIGLVLDAVVEGSGDVFFELLRAGKPSRLALDVAVFEKGGPGTSISTSAVTSATTVPRNPGLGAEGQRCRSRPRNAVSAEEPGGSVRALDLKRSLGLRYHAAIVASCRGT
jgi:hypothetical protein